MIRQGTMSPDPPFWQPMKAYDVAFSGNIEGLVRAVALFSGVVYCDTTSSRRALVVVPAEVSIARLRETLETGGTGTILLGWNELGPP